MEKVNGIPVAGVAVFKSKDGNLVTVDISVEPHQPDITNKIRITNREVQSFLEKEKNLEIEKCIKSAVVTNTTESSRVGSWTFELKKKETKPSKEKETKKPNINEIVKLTEEFGLYEKEKELLDNSKKDEVSSDLSNNVKDNSNKNKKVDISSEKS